jgi:hypothetical protein
VKPPKKYAAARSGARGAEHTGQDYIGERKPGRPPNQGIPPDRNAGQRPPEWRKSRSALALDDFDAAWGRS